MRLGSVITINKETTQQCAMHPCAWPMQALPLGAANTSLLYAILFDACMFAIAYGMWRKRWFVKV